jgi:hypothetical protein
LEICVIPTSSAILIIGCLDPASGMWTLGAQTAARLW